MTRAAGWPASCPPELWAALGGEGLALQSLWAAAPASGKILPNAGLPKQPSLWGSTPDAPLPPALTPKPHSHPAEDATLSLGRGWYPPGSPHVKGSVLVRIAIDLKVKERKGKGCRGERPACGKRPHVSRASPGERERLSSLIPSS